MEHDIPFAMELKNIAGWNQTEQDWHGYLSFDREGCFLAEFDGERAGTMTTIRYGNRIGWIGMVLVHPVFRGKGIATALLQLGIRYLQGSGVRCIKLDATAMGKKVYVPLGFQEEYAVSRHEKRIAPSSGRSKTSSGLWQDGRVEPLTVQQLSGIAAYDELIFGANRRSVLAQLSKRDERYSFYAHNARGITGYIMAHQGYEAVQIGPWAASDAQTAEALLAALLSKLDGGRVFLDLPCPNAEGMQMMEKHGFRIQRDFSRMYLGDNEFPGTPSMIYGSSGAEKG
ncbi:GNAT family N-acetyltransferase [Cohnella sp. 56]|uniref:GNAT family N-acetyltransferase n=1 Tax=Cohnella sp. 56 TaxID=3113722 RepID=UPI0030E7FEB8